MKRRDPSDPWMKIHNELNRQKDENKRLMQEREYLIINLEECKSDLFKRMPRTQISDDSVQKAVERIWESIDDFVYEVMKDVDDNALYKLCRRKQKQKRRKSPKNVITREDIGVWGPYECSNFYILSVIIQWVLDVNVFANRYPLGITPAQTRVLEEIEKGMWHASKIQSRLSACT